VGCSVSHGCVPVRALQVFSTRINKPRRERSEESLTALNSVGGIYGEVEEVGIRGAVGCRIEVSCLVRVVLWDSSALIRLQESRGYYVHVLLGRKVRVYHCTKRCNRSYSLCRSGGDLLYVLFQSIWASYFLSIDYHHPVISQSFSKSAPIRAFSCILASERSLTRARHNAPRALV